MHGISVRVANPLLKPHPIKGCVFDKGYSSVLPTRDSNKSFLKRWELGWRVKPSSPK